MPVRVVSRIPARWFRWLPYPLLRLLIVTVIVTDAVLGTLLAPFSALLYGVLATVGMILEDISESWAFWTPCQCVQRQELMATLPGKDVPERPAGPRPKCLNCGGRGGFGLWWRSNYAATVLKETR